ncbi:hypothetical protein [Granulicella mallensis]|uniref:DUF4157 domain-containing protein n=1 Tax=Granulicella mallensis TaxID=940614 RepID=A0A7W7ZQN2_9BACT|nr:hypothetical protein [Granulicella mallensis]MBB5064344.1 hypothetical protein [Granulicella mallensis]
MSLRRAVGSLVAVMVLSAALPSWSQAASPAKQDPKPTPSPQGSATSPQVDSGQTSGTVDSRLTKLQEKQLLAKLDDTFHFVSKDTGLEIKRPIKSKFTSRDEVSKFLRKKFDEDKDTKRMENSELVLKKFGLLDRDFHLRPFMLSLLTEQIAGFYDNKTQTMNLLDWVPLDQQEPVMAHELTHALQDQRVGLTKWENQEQEGIAKDVGEDNKHIQTDEVDTAREAVLEGQAMVTFADYMLRDSGKTLKDMPQVGEQLRSGAGDMGDSPVLARAPLLLQQSLLFPYSEGLAFEQEVLVKKGPARAFAGVLDSPPSSSFEIMHPDKFLAHVPVPVMQMPDIHPLLEEAGYAPYDIGVMGELDVRITAELFGGRPLAEALAPNWNGGIYYAAQRKNATEAEKQTTASLALLYSSRWKNDDSARSFFTVFEEELPRQYDGLKRRKQDEKDDTERVYSTHEGDVFLSVVDDRVWVSEGFDLTLARKLRDAVDGAQGVGPIQVASSVKGKELTGDLSHWMGSLGVVLPRVDIVSR